MIRLLVRQDDGQLSDECKLSECKAAPAAWHWLDVSQPTEGEQRAVETLFPQLRLQQKDERRTRRHPQLKVFNDYYRLTFMVIHPDTLKVHELRLFVGKRFVLTHHSDNLKAVNDIWHESRLRGSQGQKNEASTAVLRRLFERLIEQYFMAIDQLEEKVDELDLNIKRAPMRQLNRQVFRIRSCLLGFRRCVSPLQAIIQRMLTSPFVDTSQQDIDFFKEMDESLSRLMHIIESNMEITADIRDSYMALTSYRMNSIMQTLTVITVIFMPLTFIVGVYGMNFSYMPELRWHYGYFVVLSVMAGIAFAMYFWFRKKGWFDD
ncbi:MAG: magnesium/cobalt transporter CorA [Sporolactobacillus sp.]